MTTIIYIIIFLITYTVFFILPRHILIYMVFKELFCWSISIFLHGNCYADLNLFSHWWAFKIYDGRTTFVYFNLIIKFNLFNFTNLLSYNFSSCFFLFFLLPVKISFFLTPLFFPFGWNGVGIKGVLFWVCEIIRLSFLLIGSNVSFRAFGL